MEDDDEGLFEILKKWHHTDDESEFISYVEKHPECILKYKKRYPFYCVTILGQILEWDDLTMLKRFLQIAPSNILENPSYVTDRSTVFPLRHAALQSPFIGTYVPRLFDAILDSGLSLGPIPVLASENAVSYAAYMERARSTRALIWVMTREPSQMWRDFAPDIARVLLGCSVVYWKRPFFI
jgi:hypothetical protein